MKRKFNFPVLPFLYNFSFLSLRKCMRVFKSDIKIEKEEGMIIAKDPECGEMRLWGAEKLKGKAIFLFFNFPAVFTIIFWLDFSMKRKDLFLDYWNSFWSLLNSSVMSLAVNEKPHNLQQEINPAISRHGKKNL